MSTPGEDFAALSAPAIQNNPALAAPQNIPDFSAIQYGADNINAADGSFHITDPTTWGDGLENAGKFAVVSVASGLNSFYNTGATVSNWLGSDAEQNDIGDTLSSFDDDLGTFYKQHKTGADLAGFLAASLVPGLGATKLLNVGQTALRVAAETGTIGANLSRVTGLLAPATQALGRAAAVDMATSGAAYSSITGNGLKAIAAGYGQAALESAAFEIGVQATMFKSPVLDQQDSGDIVHNIITGTLTGGIIGGAITHAITYGAIKTGARSFTPAERMFSDTSNTVGLTPAQSILERSRVLNNIPEVPSVQAIATGEFAPAKDLVKDMNPGQATQAAVGLQSKLGRMSEETTLNLQLKNRASMLELTGKTPDAQLANQLTDITEQLPMEQKINNLAHLDEVGRLTTPLEAEDEIMNFQTQAAKSGSKAPIDLSKIDLEGDGGLGLAGVDPALIPPKQIQYIKLYGESAGNVTSEAPALTRIGDTVTSPEEALAKINGYGFKPGQIWNSSTVTDPIEADARYAWAQRNPQALLGNAVTSTIPTIGEHDIPLLESAMAQKINNIKIQHADGSQTVLDSMQDVYNQVQVAKSESARLLQQQGLTTPVISDMTNVKNAYLEGELPANPSQSLFARQTDKEDYIQGLQSQGVDGKELAVKSANFDISPQYAKAAYDTKQLLGVDGNQITGMAYIKAQQKLYQQGIDNAVASGMGANNFNRFYHPSDDALLQTTREGAGPGLVSFSQSGYGTTGAWAEATGAATAAMQKDIKNATTNTLAPALSSILNKQNVALEFESINKYIQSTSELYGLNPEGTGIAPLRMLDWQANMKAGSKAAPPTLQDGAREFIPITNSETLQAWALRTQLTGTRTTALQDIRNAQGLEDLKDVRALRPIRPDPKDYPYYAIVHDPAITGVGQKSMIHAASPSDLNAMIAKVPDHFEVYKGDQLDQYFKANGSFDYERSLHENYIDSSLKSSGVNNPFFQRTDPKLIADSLLRDHLRSDDVFAREAVNAKFEKEFQFLRQQDAQQMSSANSTYTGSARDIEQANPSPYMSYLKTALNINQISDHPLLQGLNTQLDKVVSQAADVVRDAFGRARNADDLGEVNQALQTYGTNMGYKNAATSLFSRDAATDVLANSGPSRGDLTAFISKANSIVSTLVCRMNPMTALNNAIGSCVNYGTETSAVLRGIQEQNPAAAGGLSKLLNSPIPTEAMLTEKGAQAVQAGKLGDMGLTQGKLMLQAIKNWTDKDAVNTAGVPLRDWYKQNNWTLGIQAQFHDMLDNLAIKGTESSSVLNNLSNKAFDLAKGIADKGESLSGNTLSNEFNRFIAADTMRQITDQGVKAGVIDSGEQMGFINSFVNRVHSSILASQRPLMFQGPVGQAVGLFQSYSFNLMQNLFRHVSEGDSKDAAMLLGLQGTLYGLQGLPGFNFLNTHIVGEASGNPNHQDAYSSTYGMVGKSVGDLLLYGIPSDMLRANMYAHGDLNPRNATIIPTNPTDIPFVNAIMKTYDNVKQSLSNVQNGGSIWQTMLQGVEHNGLSRPAAGLAQVSEAMTHSGDVFATSTKGNISGANELMSWATAARLAGAKPLDEAIANDTVMRMSAYAAADKAKMDALAESVKTTVIGGNTPEPDQQSQFAAKYASLGGKQQNFNKFMLTQIKTANTTQANKIMENLKNPFSQYMQQVMGGDKQLDGRSMQGSADVSNYDPSASMGQ